MNSFLWVVIIILVFTTAAYALRYYKLRRELHEYASRVRGQEIDTDIREIENLSSAIISLVATFNSQHALMESERLRLATVLDQITDGVLIADATGIIQFANPAAGRLFQFGDPLGHSIAEVVRNHQLVEAWRRCQQTRQMQSESVEVPTRHQYLQLIVIPDQHTSGSLLLAQDLTRIRRLETVRRDFVSNLSHELRTPLASLNALTETLQEGALDDPPAARRFVDQIQIEVIHQGDEAWEWMDYLRSRIRVARAMAAFVPALALSMELAMGLRDRQGLVKAVLASIVGAYVVAFLVSRVLEKSSRRLPKTFHLRTAEDCEHARSNMRTTREPAFWLGIFLIALGLGLIPLADAPHRDAMASVLATGIVLGGISAWVWWRTTVTFMQFLSDFRKWARDK